MHYNSNARMDRPLRVMLSSSSALLEPIIFPVRPLAGSPAMERGGQGFDQRPKGDDNDGALWPLATPNPPGTTAYDFCGNFSKSGLKSPFLKKVMPWREELQCLSFVAPLASPGSSDVNAARGRREKVHCRARTARRGAREGAGRAVAQAHTYAGRRLYGGALVIRRRLVQV